jgi:translation initiation factor IF-3
LLDPNLKNIKSKTIRLIDSDGKNLGIVDIDEAYKIAQSKNTGLIVVSLKSDPVVVKIGDYNKYIYSIKKKIKEKKISEIKEIRISFQEAEGDLKRKANQAKEFLEEGHQVRIKMILKGRQKLYSELAEDKIKKFIEFIEIPIKIINDIKKLGNNLVIIISRK